MDARTEKPPVGAACVYIDPTGRRRDALITAAWSPVGINLVYVNTDEGQEDSYGQKIARETSVTHVSTKHAPGNYWLMPDEEK